MLHVSVSTSQQPAQPLYRQALQFREDRVDSRLNRGQANVQNIHAAVLSGDDLVNLLGQDHFLGIGHYLQVVVGAFLLQTSSTVIFAVMMPMLTKAFDATSELAVEMIRPNLLSIGIVRGLTDLLVRRAALKTITHVADSAPTLIPAAWTATFRCAAERIATNRADSIFVVLVAALTEE